MKNLIYLLLISLHCVAGYAQTDSTSNKNLVPVESLINRIKPDTSSLAASDTTKADTVYIENPLNIIKAGVNFPSAFGFAFLGYERVIHYMGSVQLKVEILGTYNPLNGVSFIKEAYDHTLNINGIGFTPEFRYYGSEKYAPKGPFVGFYIPLQFGNVESRRYITSNNALYSLPSANMSYSLAGIGFDAGYQHIIKKRISIEALVGLGIARGKFTSEYYTYKYKNLDGRELESKISVKDGTIGRAFYPRAEISIGLAF